MVHQVFPLPAWQLTNEPLYKREAEIALKTTIRAVQNDMSTSRANFSLCHGAAGNAACLIYGSTVLQELYYYQCAEALGLWGIQRYEQTKTIWWSGVNDPSGLTSGGAETPGLMLGLAGTSYFYLRLAYPSLEKILLIEP